ncbi:MAG TPA: peptidoglycan DD-metalloendopeptidase family protein [Candidatus Paceibacterota bacterium]|nr:peptidoglycan DD-metalloendopeptidase family protein [Candidatus Paceibacterota bacterium]
MKNSYKPLIVAVFLAVAALGAGALRPLAAGTVEVRNAIGAPVHPPVLIDVAQGAQMAGSGAVVQDVAAVADVPAFGQGGLSAGSPAYVVGVVQDPGQPIGPVYNTAETIIYTVRKGDTLSGIASQFNTTVANIVSANPGVSQKKLKAGTSLTIPGSGPAAAVPANSLPNFNYDFILPAQGYTDGALDDHNGVNIVNSCGTPVVASADGVVVPDPQSQGDSGGWNSGYGNFILLQHAFGNGIYTRYAHLDEVLAHIGDYVKQGQQIGTIGQTGNASNCELGFMVVGAENPFGR